MNKCLEDVINFVHQGRRVRLVARVRWHYVGPEYIEVETMIGRITGVPSDIGSLPGFNIHVPVHYKQDYDNFTLTIAYEDVITLEDQ